MRDSAYSGSLCTGLHTVGSATSAIQSVGIVWPLIHPLLYINLWWGSLLSPPTPPPLLPPFTMSSPQRVIVLPGKLVWEKPQWVGGRELCMMGPAGRKDGSVGDEDSEAGQTSPSSDSQQRGGRGSSYWITVSWSPGPDSVCVCCGLWAVGCELTGSPLNWRITEVLPQESPALLRRTERGGNE